MDEVFIEAGGELKYLWRASYDAGLHLRASMIWINGLLPLPKTK